MKQNIQGDAPQGALDDTNNNPVKVGGVARKTNPTAVQDGQRVSASLDDLGRQLVRYQVRDLIKTGYVALANGTKTVLAAGDTGEYLDLYQISLANSSNAAVTVTLTDESTIVLSIPVAASGVTNLDFIIPLKQSATGVGWYVDIPDISGTTVTITAAFTKET